MLILYSKLLYQMGQDYLDIKYIGRYTEIRHNVRDGQYPALPDVLMCNAAVASMCVFFVQNIAARARTLQ